MVRLLRRQVGYGITRLELARASTARTEANRAQLDAMETRNLDASTFNTWFIAYTAGNADDMAIAERRFRPEFKVAFDAWIATNPKTNPDSPPGPTYMPEYQQPDAEKAKELDASADDHFNLGEEDGTTADKYVRTTVFLATVLFLVGISGHFRVRSAALWTGDRRGAHARRRGRAADRVAQATLLTPTKIGVSLDNMCRSRRQLGGARGSRGGAAIAWRTSPRSGASRP